MAQQLTSDGRLRASLKEEIEEMALGKKTAEERLAAAEEKMKVLIEEKVAAEASADMSSGEVVFLTQRVSELESDLVLVKADLESEINARMSLQVEVAEKKAEIYRGNRELNEATSRLHKQNTLVQSLSDKLASAALDIEAAKTDAVAAFKDSPDFTKVVAECSADSYRLGFADCKGAVSEHFPNLDLSRIVTPGDEELSGEEEGGIEANVAGFVEEVVEALQTDEGDPIGSVSAFAALADTPAQPEELPTGADAPQGGEGVSAEQGPPV